MKISSRLFVLAILAIVSGLATSATVRKAAAQNRTSLADKHAPAFLMGDHVHDPAEWMLEYKYMNMYMDGNKLGSRKLTDQESLTVGQSLGTNFGATPTRMNMEMHMLHIMYGLTENMTLYAMPQWSNFTMDHIRGSANPAPAGPGSPFRTQNAGFDDLVLGSLFNIYEGNDTQVVFNAGFSVPTGDLDATSSSPTGGLVEQELPYPMRRGSGTFNARPAVTLKKYFDWYSTGLQYSANIPVGVNNENYSVGNEHRVNSWVSALMTNRFALSYRVEGLWRSNFDGADTNLNPMVISTARPDMRGGEWINFGYGAMWLIGEGNLLNVELTHPVYEHFSGIQLENDFWLTASLSKSFGRHRH